VKKILESEVQDSTGKKTKMTNTWTGQKGVKGQRNCGKEETGGGGGKKKKKKNRG